MLSLTVTCMNAVQVIKYYADKVVALQANKPAADVAKQINVALASN